MALGQLFGAVSTSGVALLADHIGGGALSLDCSVSSPRIYGSRNPSICG